MTIISATSARERFFGLLTTAARTGEPIVIRYSPKPAAGRPRTVVAKITPMPSENHGS